MGIEMHQANPTNHTTTNHMTTLFTGSTRGQSIPATQAIMLALVISSIFGIVVVGGDVIVSEQAELATVVMGDDFEQFADGTESTVRGRGPQRVDISIPPGGFVAETNATYMTITNTSTGESVEVPSAGFEYTPLQSDTIIQYGLGLVSVKQDAQIPPTIESVPDSTVYRTDGGDKVYKLDLTQVNATSPVVFTPVFNRELTYNIYPNATQSEEKIYGAGDANITVISENYEAWARYFNSSSVYASPVVDSGSNKVEVKVRPRMKLNVRYATIALLDKFQDYN